MSGIKKYYEIKNYNNTNYSLSINKQISDLDQKYEEDERKGFLLNHQYIVKEYLIKRNVRGLLIFHSTGVGKSITASSIADFYRKYEPDRKIIVLLPKTLQSNFENSIAKYMRNDPMAYSREKTQEFIEEVIKLNYNFISLNSSNMFEKIKKTKKATYEEEMEKKLDQNLGSFTNSVKGMLENSLLIIDEFHNLSNAITNGSKNAVNLYNMIMNTRNIKLVFLTGTPIINNPFELVPTFNMLKGYIYDYDISTKRKFTLFPENRDDFNKFFIKNKDSINNKQKFQNRIFGLVSYYGDFYFDKKNKEEFPDQKDLIVEKVPMSVYQFARYQEARELELKEESNKFNKGSKNEYFVTKDSSGSTSSYRIRTRQIGNFFIPDYALEFTNGRKSVTKYINKIKANDLSNLDKFSPKFKKVLENINKYKNQLGVVYSEFVSGEGIALFSMILELHGYVYWDKSKQHINLSNEIVLDNSNLMDAESEEEHIYNSDTELATSDVESKKSKKGGNKDNTIKKEKTYAIITGDIPIIERQKIVNSFNKKENITGNIISLLLLSKSGAEGLNLHNVRHLHIMEPFWNYARIEQVIARGVRYQGHIMLPKSEQNIQPYIYISTYPKNYNNKNKERSTDEEIYYNAMVGKKLRDEFAIAMLEASIDCSVHAEKAEGIFKSKFSCYLCAPTNEQLYEVDIFKEINKENPCKSISEKKEIKAKEIIIPINGEDNKFYYTKSDEGLEIKIFRYSRELNGYVLLRKSYPYYADIVKAILDLSLKENIS